MVSPVKNKHPAKTEGRLNSDPDLSDGDHPPPHKREGWGHPCPLSSSIQGEMQPRPEQLHNRAWTTTGGATPARTRFLRIRGSLLTFDLANKRTNANASSDHLPPVSRARTTNRALPTGPTSSGVRAFLPASCNRQDSAIRVSSMRVWRSVGVEG